MVDVKKRPALFVHFSVEVLREEEKTVPGYGSITMTWVKTICGREMTTGHTESEKVLLKSGRRCPECVSELEERRLTAKYGRPF